MRSLVSLKRRLKLALFFSIFINLMLSTAIKTRVQTKTAVCILAFDVRELKRVEKPPLLLRPS